MKKREKRGLSNIIVTVLFVLLVIAAAGILYSVIKKYVAGSNLEQGKASINCISDVKIEILNACYQGNLFKITIKNKGSLILGDFFLIDLFYLNGTSEIIPTPYNTFINPYQTKTVIVPYHENLEKIMVIPKIENQAYLCYQNAPEFKSIKEC